MTYTKIIACVVMTIICCASCATKKLKSTNNLEDSVEIVSDSSKPNTDGTCTYFAKIRQIKNGEIYTWEFESTKNSCEDAIADVKNSIEEMKNEP